MRSKIVTLVMIAAVAGNVVAAGAAETASAGPIEISWMMPTSAQPIPGNVDPNDNQFANLFKEALPNIKINWIFVDEYDQAVNLRVASGDMPDAFDPANYFMRGVSEELWKDLGPVVKTIESLSRQSLLDELIRYVTVDGTIYAIPAQGGSPGNPRNLSIRKDWMEKLGLDMPTDLDELMEIMKAFTFDDPDGNGQDDTYGCAFVKDLGFADWALIPFGLYGFEFGSGINATSIVDGELVPDIVNPRMKEALEYIRTAWSEGVVDPDSPMQDHSQFWGRGRQGIYGVISMAAHGVLNVANAGFKTANSGAEYIAVDPPLHGPYGDGGVRVCNLLYTKYVVPVDRSDEVAQAVGDVFDWFLDSGWDIVANGLVEGKHYETITLADGSVAKQPLGRSLDDEDWRFHYRLTYQRQHWGQPEYIKMFYSATVAMGLHHPDFLKVLQWGLDPGIARYDLYRIPSELMAEGKINLEPHFFEVAMRIIIGELPLDAFDEWVEFFYDNGGQEIIDDLNRLNPVQ